MKFHLPKSLSGSKLPRIGNRRKPSHDWLLLLSLSLIVLIASIGWNVWAFIRITSGEVIGDSVPTATGPDITSVEKVREVFLERAAEEGRYRTEYRFVDPSR